MGGAKALKLLLPFVLWRKDCAEKRDQILIDHKNQAGRVRLRRLQRYSPPIIRPSRQFLRIASLRESKRRTTLFSRVGHATSAALGGCGVCQDPTWLTTIPIARQLAQADPRVLRVEILLFRLIGQI